MRPLVKRLQALEGGQASVYDAWSDAELIDRVNAISLELRPFGFATLLLDGGPEDVERIKCTQGMIRDAVHQT